MLGLFHMSCMDHRKCIHVLYIVVIGVVVLLQLAHDTSGNLKTYFLIKA
jgi:hypothetical protein